MTIDSVPRPLCHAMFPLARGRLGATEPRDVTCAAEPMALNQSNLALLTLISADSYTSGPQRKAAMSAFSDLVSPAG